jgi:glycosyltransferase involved in cell wall biosynthesis
MEYHPKISVVTPSYNQAAFLDRTILSIVSQNYPNLEYIVMDGGSTDGSIEIIKKYAKYITYWTSAPDHGQADAIANGFEKATGDIFCWINSDDMLMPDALQYVADRFLRNPQRQWLVGSTVVVDEEDIIFGYRKSFPLWTSRIVFSSGQGTAQPGCFWQKELYKKVGGINRDRQFCMDYELFAKFICVAKPMWTAKVLGVFRLQPESKTSKMDEVRVQENRLVREMYKESIPVLEARCYTLLKILWDIIPLNVSFSSQKLTIPKMGGI